VTYHVTRGAGEWEYGEIRNEVFVYDDIIVTRWAEPRTVLGGAAGGRGSAHLHCYWLYGGYACAIYVSPHELFIITGVLFFSMRNVELP